MKTRIYIFTFMSFIHCNRDPSAVLRSNRRQLRSRIAPQGNRRSPSAVLRSNRRQLRSRIAHRAIGVADAVLRSNRRRQKKEIR